MAQRAPNITGRRKHAATPSVVLVFRLIEHKNERQTELEVRDTSNAKGGTSTEIGSPTTVVTFPFVLVEGASKQFRALGRGRLITPATSLDVNFALEGARPSMVQQPRRQ